MKYFISLLALGDNLISLSLLKQLDKKVKILGTKHTKNIIELIGANDKFDLEIVFDDIPAFYDIAKQGILQSIKDFFTFIKYIKKNNIQEIVFEKKDFRSSLVSLFTNIKIYYPNNLNLKVYNNRQELISTVYRQSLDMKSYLLTIDKPKIIVINPLTRVELRNIKHNHLKHIIDTLKSSGYEIYLIDIENRYIEFESKVQHYLTNTTLDDVRQLIEKCDLYIGGDSFLIHLAYYLKRNYFILFYRDNDNFLPPNVYDDFYIKAHKCNDFEKELNNKFKNIGLIK